MRETKFSILKAIAIMLIVLSHAGISGWLFNFVFLFHVPVFFLCAGYFFHTKYLNDERTFVLHRIKGLYLPFVRWSIFFLLVHNVFFSLGLLSENYGNAAGGVTHPYNFTQFSQHLWSIVVNMSGYDQFLCGSFWFFRSLFIGSIAFLLLFKLVNALHRIQGYIQAAWGVILILFLLIIWKLSVGIHLTGVSQGGYRELMGMLFMAIGFLIRQYDVSAKLNWKVAFSALGVLVLASVYFPTSMKWNPQISDFISLPVSAVAGFLVLLYLATLIDSCNNLIKRGLVYIGERTLYVFAFHLVAFKVVSAIKVAYYGLPWESVGGHPYVITPANNWFWILFYTLAGVALPLLWLIGYRKVVANVNISQKQALSACVHGVQLVFRLTVRLSIMFYKGLKSLLRKLKRGFMDILAASNPRKE